LGRFDVGVLQSSMIKQLPNLKSLHSPATKMRKATKSADIDMVLGLGFTQCHRQHSHSIVHT